MVQNLQMADLLEYFSKNSLEMSELLLKLLFVGLRVAFDEILQLRQVVGQLVILSFGHCV
jgi:hypothetical protein